MVHEIFHAMFESNKIRFYWFIHLTTDVNGETLEIIESLEIDVHESTNPEMR